MAPVSPAMRNSATRLVVNPRAITAPVTLPVANRLARVAWTAKPAKFRALTRVTSWEGPTGAMANHASSPIAPQPVPAARPTEIASKPPPATVKSVEAPSKDLGPNALTSPASWIWRVASVKLACHGSGGLPRQRRRLCGWRMQCLGLCCPLPHRP